MENEYNPTPWVVDDFAYPCIRDVDGEKVMLDDVEALEFIVARVNACEGVDTEDLTHGCYQKLIEKHVEVHFAKQDAEAQRDELLAKKLWVNWNAATGVPYISDFCESELAPEQLTADWVNRMVVERYELLRAVKDLLKVANVRIDDPRIGQFDAARAAIAKVEGGNHDPRP